MKLGQAELLVIDEAAAIPLPLVKKLLGPYLVFMASTINGWEWSCIMLFFGTKNVVVASVQLSSAWMQKPFCISSAMKELDVRFPLNWSSSWDSRARKANRTRRQRTEPPTQRGWQQVNISNVFNRCEFHRSDCRVSVCSQLARSTRSPFTSPSATLQQTLSKNGWMIFCVWTVWTYPGLFPAALFHRPVICILYKLNQS